jgi:hypothetical protein
VIRGRIVTADVTARPQSCNPAATGRLTSLQPVPPTIVV